MIKKLAAFGLIIALSGCGSINYTFEGKKFDNEETFQTAVEDERVRTISQVQKLQKLLTNKKLIAALPSEQAFYAENTRRYASINGKIPTGPQNTLYVNLAKVDYKITRVYFEAIQKRGIYSSVEIREMPVAAISIEPSPDYDVIYFTIPTVSSGQVFYASVKEGKQVFAFDGTGEGTTAKVNSFIEAVQLQAIKD